MQKECKEHGLTDFALRKEGTKERYRCKKCAVDAVNKRRRKVKGMAVDYKGGCCVRCGYDKSVWALEFHHIDPTQKDFAISSSGHCKSWDKVKCELDKCILVCSNCHSEIHEELNSGLEA